MVSNYWPPNVTVNINTCSDLGIRRAKTSLPGLPLDAHVLNLTVSFWVHSKLHHPSSWAQASIIVPHTIHSGIESNNLYLELTLFLLCQKKEGMYAHNSTYYNFMHKAYHIHKERNILWSSNHQTNKWKWFQKTVVKKHKSIKTENTTIKIFQGDML